MPLFPLDQPQATAVYLLLYVGTFALHQWLMHYVLAGSLYVAWTAWFPGRGDTPRWQQPLAGIVRDWMPFLLSAAITAGVAPLLFVQVLYAREFYTANLLLWWRWMVVIPVLIAAFYLLYVVKSNSLITRPVWIGRGVTLAASAGFLFVGFCWTMNTLLSSRPETWAEVYATGVLPTSTVDVLCRMLVWIGGSFASFASIAGWQLAFRSSYESRGGLAQSVLGLEMRRLSTLSIAGLLVASAAALAYAARVERVWQSMASPAAWPYLALVGLGLLLQFGGWTWQWSRSVVQAGAVRRTPLAVASAGCWLTLLSVSMLRELLRTDQIGLPALYARHAKAAEIGGFTCFVLVGVVTFGLMAFCVRLAGVFERPTADSSEPGENPH